MFICIHKSKGITSHDVVDVVRKATGERRVGHAGTLDPLATGVLVVAVGREFTKQISKIVEKEKEYVATVYLGKTSTTDDEEGEKTETTHVQVPTIDNIGNVLKEFMGKIRQIPSIYSAVKIKGKEAYKYARKGQHVEMKPREMEIKAIEVLEYSFPTLKIKVTTGPGVYIRSLARDIGEKLGTGAYLSDLVRTRVGSYVIEESVKLDDLDDYIRSINKSRVV
jgi:tRNA pseudouridine55 synthase